MAARHRSDASPASPKRAARASVTSRVAALPPRQQPRRAVEARGTSKQRRASSGALAPSAAPSPASAARACRSGGSPEFGGSWQRTERVWRSGRHGRRRRLPFHLRVWHQKMRGSQSTRATHCTWPWHCRHLVRFRRHRRLQLRLPRRRRARRQLPRLQSPPSRPRQCRWHSRRWRRARPCRRRPWPQAPW